MAWFLSKSDGMGGVLCGCVNTCCMYPWPDPPGTPLYPATDLLDFVDFSGETLAHDAGQYKFTGATYYIIAGTAKWEVRLVADDSLLQSQDFLVCNGVTDQFANTYIVHDETDTDPDFTITRIGSCEYSGVLAGSISVFFTYGGIGTSFPFKWQMGFGGGSLAHDNPQTGIVGHYGPTGSGYVVF